MRKFTRSILATTAAVGLLAIPVAGAGASSNTVEFTVAEGTTLSVANDDSKVTLTSGDGALDFGTTDQTMTGDLPATTVTDERGGILAGWTVTVSSGDWARDNADGEGDHTIDRSNARVALPVLEGTTDLATGALTGMLVTEFESQELSLVDDGANNLGADAGDGYTLIAGQTELGSGAITYTPGIEINVPASTPSGTYRADVVQTIE